MKNNISTISEVPIYEWVSISPEFKKLIQKYDEQFKQITNSYVSDCIENNVELFSAYGWFLQTMYANLGIAICSLGVKHRITMREQREANESE